MATAGRRPDTPERMVWILFFAQHVSIEESIFFLLSLA